MTAFGILVKSHAADLPYLDRLISSYVTFNREKIPLFLVVPDRQLVQFGHLSGLVTEILVESEFAAHLTATEVAGFSAGYINQEIIKLCFWETGRVDNYLCLDSDAEFIREFGHSDFMANAGTPFTFLSTDARLHAEPDYYRQHWVHRQPQLQRIAHEIGHLSEPLKTVHGQAVFSAVVLRSFQDEFLAPRSWDYVDALAIAPYEPTWYSIWLQHSQAIPIVAREPVFRTFHNAGQHLDYLLMKVSAEDAARGFVGVIVNSNYSRGAGVIGFRDDLATCLAAYFSEGELLRALAKSLRLRAHRHPGVHR